MFRNLIPHSVDYEMSYCGDFRAGTMPKGNKHTLLHHPCAGYLSWEAGHPCWGQIHQGSEDTGMWSNWIKEEDREETVHLM